MMKTLTMAAALAAVPVLASAATIGPFSLGANQDFSRSFTFLPAGSTTDAFSTTDTVIEFDFDVTESIFIDNFAVSGSSTGNGSNLANISFGLSLPGSGDFAGDLDFKGTEVTAEDFFDGQNFAANSSFSVFFETPGVNRQTSVTVSFDTLPGRDINIIPLPAAGALMVLGLGGLALVRRRKA